MGTLKMRDWKMLHRVAGLEMRDRKVWNTEYIITSEMQSADIDNVCTFV